VAVRGEGSYVFTDKGERLLDFATGIGVTSTGHSHPKVVKAIQDQAAKMIHAQVGACRLCGGCFSTCSVIST
jgi:4-aminobutyrate aminotransferase